MSFYGERFSLRGEEPIRFPASKESVRHDRPFLDEALLWDEMQLRANGAYPVTELDKPESEITLAATGLVEWAQNNRAYRPSRLTSLNDQVGIVRALLRFARNDVALVEHYNLREVTRQPEHKHVPGVAVIHLGRDHVNSYQVLGAVTRESSEFTLGRAAQTQPLINRPHIGGGLYSTSVAKTQAQVRYQRGDTGFELSVRNLSDKNPTLVMGVMGAVVTREVLRARPPRESIIPMPREEPLVETTMTLDVTALRTQFNGKA